MASIVAVLAVIALVAGGFLGTFRHRAYGVWSLAGVLIAITTADIIGTSIGVWMASSIGTTDVNAVFVIVKTSVLVMVSLIISYYASDLLPAQTDPKTRADNIMSGMLGVFNAFLIVSTILRYMQVLNNDFTTNVFGDGNGFNFNRMFIDALPWISSVLVLYIVGWSSVRKFKLAWAKLRGTANPATPASNTTTTGTNYQANLMSSPSAYTQPYTAPTNAPTAPATNDTGEKKGWFAGIGSWLRRDNPSNDPNASLPNQPATNAGYTAPTYQGTSGATPPYGIATGGTSSTGSGYGAGFTPSSSSSTSTGYTAPSSGYAAPTYGAGSSTYGSGYNTTPSSTTGYTPTTNTTGYSSSTTGYTPSTGTTGYSSSTTGYTPAPSTTGYSPSTTGYTPTTNTTGYTPYGTPASPTPGYSTSTPSTSPYGAYNPNVSSGFTSGTPPTQPPAFPSATDAAVGGVVAGGMFASFANQPGSGFGDASAYQDSNEEDGYFEDDEDDDSPYPSGYRG